MRNSLVDLQRGRMSTTSLFQFDSDSGGTVARCFFQLIFLCAVRPCHLNAWDNVGKQGAQRQFLENISSEDDLRSRVFGTFAVKFLACLPLLGFSNI